MKENEPKAIAVSGQKTRSGSGPFSFSFFLSVTCFESVSPIPMKYLNTFLVFLGEKGEIPGFKEGNRPACFHSVEKIEILLANQKKTILL